MKKLDSGYSSICSRYSKAKKIKEPFPKRVEYAFVVLYLINREKGQDNILISNLPEPSKILTFNDDKIRELEKTLSEHYSLD